MPPRDPEEPVELTEEEREIRLLTFLKREIRKLARGQLHMREKFFAMHDAMNRMHAAHLAGEEYAYPDELLPVVALPAEGNEVLFLSFSGINLALGMPAAEFLRSFSKRGVPGYFIKDFRQSWYQQGLLGLCETPYETADYLRKIVERHGCKRLVTLGASSGGYAAILFGSMLGADRAVAFSPQTRIDERVVNRFSAADTPEATEFLELHPELHDLRKFIDGAAHVPETKVFYGADHGRDPAEAQRLEGHSKVTLIPVEGVDKHTITTTLKARGDLDAILDDLVTF